MIIDALIFFAFVLLFLVVGVIVAITARIRRRNIARSPEEALKAGEFTFLRQNWFLIVLIIIVINPVTIHWMRAAAHKKNYREQLRNPENATGSDSSGDTTYHVAATPDH